MGSGFIREAQIKVPAVPQVLLSMPYSNTAQLVAMMACAPRRHFPPVALFPPHQFRDKGQLFAPGFVLGAQSMLLVMLLHLIGSAAMCS